MAVTYVNNWNNILTALKTKIKTEFRIPVYSGWDFRAKGSQFLRIIPMSSDQIDKAGFIERRIFNMDCQYYFLRRHDVKFEEYVTDTVSRLEALVHENLVLTLADGTTACDVSMGLLQFNFSIDDERFDKYFIVNWELTCEHYGNAA